MTSKYLSPLRILIGLGHRAESLHAKRVKNKRVAYARDVLKNATFPLKVNVGCGNEPFEDWINLDLSPDTRADILWDVTEGLPVPDNSCAYIYNEHFLEHLPVQEGVRFLAECRRSLEPGGVVRIGMPCVQEVARQYHEDTWAQQPWLAKYGYTWIKTRAEYINIGFREWGHQWLYDFEELDRRLREAAFDRIERAAWGESKHPALTGRETREETVLICEATK
jgi:predicted SAM-dependent methyltransferase